MEGVEGTDGRGMDGSQTVDGRWKRREPSERKRLLAAYNQLSRLSQLLSSLTS